jgi:hypothetical protein
LPARSSLMLPNDKEMLAGSYFAKVAVVAHGRLSGKLAELISNWGQPARESFRSWIHRLVRRIGA